jgi:hypothetical protein
MFRSRGKAKNRDTNPNPRMKTRMRLPFRVPIIRKIILYKRSRKMIVKKNGAFGINRLMAASMIHLREKIARNDHPSMLNVDHEKIFFNISFLSFIICFADKIKMANVLNRNMFANMAKGGKKKIDEYFSVGISRQKTVKSFASPAPHVSVK